MKYNKTKYPNIYTYETTKGKRYYIRRGFYLQGRKKEVTKSNLKTLQEARAALAEIEQKIESNGFEVEKNLTCDQYWDVYFEKCLKSGKWAPDTEINKQSIYSLRFQPIFGQTKLNKLSRHTYELYINDLLNKHSKHSVRQFHGVFMAMLNDAVACGNLDRNPLRKIYIGESKVKARSKQTSLETFKRFDKVARETLDDYDYTILRMTYFGLRRSEVVAIKFNNLAKTEDGRYQIHLDESRTKQRPDGNQRMKTLSSERTISLDYETTQLLDRALRTSRNIASKYGRILAPTDFIFLADYKTHRNRLGKPIPTERVNKLFAKVNKQTGLNISPHMMRHFFATQGVLAGVPITHMAAALGHKTSYMTQKYTHIKDEVSASVTDTFMQAIQ